MPFIPGRKRKTGLRKDLGEEESISEGGSTCSHENSISRLHRGRLKLWRMMSLTKDHSTPEQNSKHAEFRSRDLRSTYPARPVQPELSIHSATYPYIGASSSLQQNQQIPQSGNSYTSDAQLIHLDPTPACASYETIRDLTQTKKTDNSYNGQHGADATSEQSMAERGELKFPRARIYKSQSSPLYSIANRLSSFVEPSTVQRCSSRNSKPPNERSVSISPLLIDTMQNPVQMAIYEPKGLRIDTSLQAAGGCDSGGPRIIDSLSPTSNNQESPCRNSVFSATPSVSTAPSILSSPSSSGKQCKTMPLENIYAAQNCEALPTIGEFTPPSTLEARCLKESICHPSIAIVEKAVATKVFFETYYTGLTVGEITPRSLRRRDMELGLIDARKSPSERVEIRRSFVQAETDHLRVLRKLKARKLHEAKGISAAGYEVVRLLGKGSFGVVSLVREKRREGARSTSRNGAVYAMKVIRKSEMLRNSQEGHLRAERDFLVSCAERSRWVVPLVASFQDLDNLHLVMEFQIGGDFLNFLLTAKGGIISEDWTRWYVAEMILCVEEAHKMKWIHRDVKPDNFLISASGHLKIADFGLAFDGHWAHTQAYYNNHRYSLLESLGIEVDGDEEDRPPPVPPKGGQVVGPSEVRAKKHLETRFAQRKLARSIVGTSQYMAPEVVSGQWYDGRCDWWSIGIIAFECLYGFTPFCREDRDATKRAITRHSSEFQFPKNHQGVSREARDLIWRLLQHKQIRLCSKKYMQNDYKRDNRGMAVLFVEDDKSSKDYAGHHVYPQDADDIKRHSFFASLPWDCLHLTQPPFVPQVKRDDSTKYFDSEEQILADCSSLHGSLAIAAGVGKPIGDKERLMAAGIDGMDGERDNKRPMVQKRPRDKLLRDPKTAKTVLEVRKKSAFLGYTYRRPTTWSLGDDIRLASEISNIGF